MTAELRRVLEPATRFERDCALETQIIGEGVDAYLWIGALASERSEGYCFGTLSGKPFRSFLAKAVGRVFPGSQIVAKKGTKR